MSNIIYGLFDPITGELRYIGYTSNRSKRYSAHHHKLNSKSHKNNWIKSLLSKGLKAEMCAIETYETAEELPCAEIECIEYFRSIGCDLVNETNGGDGLLKGNKRKPPSEETKRKMSLAAKGRKNSEEAKLKMSEYQKNRSKEHGIKLKESRNKRPPHSTETKKRMSETRRALAEIARLAKAGTS